MAPADGTPAPDPPSEPEPSPSEGGSAPKQRMIIQQNPIPSIPGLDVAFPALLGAGINIVHAVRKGESPLPVLASNAVLIAALLIVAAGTGSRLPKTLAWIYLGTSVAIHIEEIVSVTSLLAKIPGEEPPP